MILILPLLVTLFGLAAALPKGGGGGGSSFGGFSSGSSSAGGGFSDGSSSGFSSAGGSLGSSSTFIYAGVASEGPKNHMPGCLTGASWAVFKKPEWDTKTHNDTYVAIGTEWIISHNKNIQKAMAKTVGMIPVSKKDRPSECLWRDIGTPKRLGVELAYLATYNENDCYYAKNHTKYDVSEDLMKAMRSALQPTYPIAEIVILVVSTVVLLPMLVCCCCACREEKRGIDR